MSEDGQQIRRGAVSGELDSEKLFLDSENLFLDSRKLFLDTDKLVLDSEQAARGNGDLEVSEDGQQLRRISPVPEGDVTIDRSLSGGLRS